MNYSSGGFNIPPDNNYTAQNSSNLKIPHFIEPALWFREKINLKRLSSLSAFAVLGYILISAIVVGIMQGAFAILQNIPSFDYNAFSEKWNSAEFQYAFDALYSVFVVGLPFFGVGIFAHKKGYLTTIPTGKPKNPKMLPIVVFGAFGMCLSGNFVVSYIDAIVNMLTGFEIEMPDMPVPQKSFIGILICFISISVVPALVEEFALRGVIMQMLRRYGDNFALLTSALIFGLMHCNLQQIPFAFIAGYAIGYAVIITDSLWTGVIIHFLNNAFSAAMALITDTYGFDSPETKATTVVFYALILIGLLCTIMVFRNQDRCKLKKSPLVNQGKDFYGRVPMFSAKITTGKLFREYLFTAPMIIAYIAVAYQTIALIMAM